MDFKPFHDYQKMVRRGAAEPLTCDHCNTEYVLRAAAFTTEPVLQCFGCGSLVTPGLRVYSDICKAVDDYFKRNND